jgi:hypothetical protein
MNRQHAKGLFSEGWLNAVMAILLLMFLFDSALAYADATPERHSKRFDYPGTGVLLIDLPKHLESVACYIQGVFHSSQTCGRQRQGRPTASFFIAGGEPQMSGMYLDSGSNMAGSYLKPATAIEGNIRRHSIFIGYRREW